MIVPGFTIAVHNIGAVRKIVLFLRHVHNLTYGCAPISVFAGAQTQASVLCTHTPVFNSDVMPVLCSSAGAKRRERKVSRVLPPGTLDALSISGILRSNEQTIRFCAVRPVQYRLARAIRIPVFKCIGYYTFNRLCIHPTRLVSSNGR